MSTAPTSMPRFDVCTRVTNCIVENIVLLGGHQRTLIACRRNLGRPPCRRTTVIRHIGENPEYREAYSGHFREIVIWTAIFHLHSKCEAERVGTCPHRHGDVAHAGSRHEKTAWQRRRLIERFDLPLGVGLHPGS